MKPNPVGLIILGSVIFWAAAISLWWTRGIAEATAIMLGVLMAIGGAIVISVRMTDPKEPRK